MKKLRVGVTIFIREGEQSLWENGIFQNCLYLVRLLQKCDIVGQACLVAVGSSDLAHSRLLVDVPLQAIGLDEALQTLDVVIEMSAQLDPRWIDAFRLRGKSVVAMRVGNDYVIDVERMMFNKPHALLANRARYDEVWTLQQYEKSGKPYYESIWRIPVQIMPHLWSPEVLDRALQQHGMTFKFGYRTGRSRWRMGIVEPNICMVKTCFIPLLSCEMAHRLNPQMLERVVCYNSSHLLGEAHFKHFTSGLDVVRHGLTQFETRIPMFAVLGDRVDGIFSHQWENAQNYVYYEVLYGGYPLIHNSPILRQHGVGYCYDAFDCEAGGQTLLKAHAQHDHHISEYRQNAKRYLQTVGPDHPHNIQVYSQALMRVMQMQLPSLQAH
jgi:hypothetical protein